MKKFCLAALLIWSGAALLACKKEQEPLPRLPAKVGPTANASMASTSTEAIPRHAPYVPPQCYTKTQDADGKVHNPCFTCHVETPPPNYIHDGGLQLAYEFGPVTRFNPWTNVFVDRSAAVAAQSDSEVLAYVREDNYRALARRLASHSDWDIDKDGKWSGWVPDIGFDFDERGFDRNADGSLNGWRAYMYFPVPGTFWPTNGSFGDALIRLPAEFQQNAEAQFERSIYIANLAIAEALMARRDVPLELTDETAWGVDLDGDGRLAKAKKVKFRWKAGAGGMSWVGLAGALQKAGRLQLAAGLLPAGTEFAHSVRYLDVNHGRVRMAARMKELRYMKKVQWKSFGQLEFQAVDEAAEKMSSPDKLRIMLGSSERGMFNGAGWRLQGFIEEQQGDLRPQTVEEHAFCIGCHSGIGATDDSIFSFGRKLLDEETASSWQYQPARGFEGIAEPRRADGRGEYSLYLEENGAGDELRANDEVLGRFFDASGAVRPEMKARLASDISVLLLPSPERALRLDKAYRVIVQEQSFARGRDATITPAKNVHRELGEEEPATGIAAAISERRAAPESRKLAQAGN